MCVLKQNLRVAPKSEKLSTDMADFSGEAVSRCIAAVVNEGMKLQLVIKKFEVNIQSRTPQYQRLYRHIGNLKAQKELQNSAWVLCFVACEMILYLFMLSFYSYCCILCFWIYRYAG
jgi:hypothetical protein